MAEFHPSAHKVLTDLRKSYPDTPFLALGQTVWWDEPMKAVLLRLLEQLNLGGKMFLGVHDTDYFAKVKVRQSGQAKFELLPHNDGDTKDLWSAAGEISRLFGSETLPARHDFLKHGVPFDRLTKDKADHGQQFVNEVTEAWGWRGLVYTGSRDLIVHHLKLSEFGGAIEEMLRYGFEGAIESLADECCRNEARNMANELLAWVGEYCSDNPELTLSDLYQHLFPNLVGVLLNDNPDNIEVTCTACLLRLDPETAKLPRFEFVDLFLNEKTRKLAAEAYDHAVQGTEVYTLDRFGLGALPFDVIVPEHGRGTLRVTLRAIHVETRTPIRIPLKKPIQSVIELAQVLTDQFGDQVVLVGKAVALISMLAREFIFVFNEEGSGYVHRTRAMNDYLHNHGVGLQAHPILRLKYQTWDSLEVGLANVQLPKHLQRAFGESSVESARFASQWRKVATEQNKSLDYLKTHRSPRDLMGYLAKCDGVHWDNLRQEYDRAKQELLQDMARPFEIQTEVRDLYRQLKSVKEEIVRTERERGDHFRTAQDWTPDEESKRTAFAEKLTGLLQSRRSILDQIVVLKERRLSLERDAKTMALRNRITSIETEAQTAKLELVRDALLTTRGLNHTNHRPSAWWLPMVDPKGYWFRRIVETTEVYTEPLLS